MTVKRWLGSNSAEVVVRFLIVGTIVVSGVTYVKWHNLATCQARYNQAYAQYAVAAREAGAQDSAVVQQLFTSLWNARKAANNVLVQKAVEDAFNKYFATIEANKKFRQEHPPPPLPDQYCG